MCVCVYGGGGGGGDAERKGGWLGWWCALLPNQPVSKYSISEQQEEAHVLPYNVKYLWDITLPLLNKANKAPFWTLGPHLSQFSFSRERIQLRVKCAL